MTPPAILPRVTGIRLVTKKLYQLSAGMEGRPGEQTVSSKQLGAADDDQHQADRKHAPPRNLAIPKPTNWAASCVTTVDN